MRTYTVTWMSENIVLETDSNKLKNSVMTFYRIRERNLKKLMEKNASVKFYSD